MKNKNFPDVSIVICTLNCNDYLKRCLSSIRKQSYPQKKVEILVVDSYSTDGTIETAKSFGAKVILTKIRGYMEGKGMPKSIGCEKAKGDIIITIDSDNSMVEKDWIEKMVFPLMNDKTIDYCICRMLISKSDPLINQYLSYVGTDPFAIYSSLDPQISLKSVPLKDKGKYFVYNNRSDRFLITGGYYLAFKKTTLKKIGGYSRDVDVAFKLASKESGSNIAIPKNAHLHHLMTKSTSDFLKKKVKWALHYFRDGNKGREFKWASGFFGRHGKFNFGLQVLKNLLVLPAILTTIRMLFIYRDKSWIMHVPMTFSTTAAYIYAYVKTRFKLSSQK